MTLLPYIRWLHLVAAATWLGGIITLAGVVFGLRRAGVERAVLQIAARAFAKLSWTAMIVAIATGIAQVEALRLPWSYRALHEKLAVVAATIAVAIVHQRLAKTLKPALRGVMEAALLVLSLAIFAAAIRL